MKRAFIFTSLLVGFLPFALFAQDDIDLNKTPLPPDIRLVIDVSGSMKRNDPNNLRQPAVDLLVQLLPEASRSGVWTFGKWVNMLVPHKDVTDSWREGASDKSSEINSVGLYTNIGEALEKAAYDMENRNQSFDSSIILLTDGMVDIAKDPQKNTREWRRIVDEILPKLKASGFKIHTIALSDNADRDLMNRLSLETDGVAAVAKTADDLMKIFLKAFDASAPAEQVPLAGNGFVIDSSVEEFTLLIFKKDKNKATELVGPDNEKYHAKSVSNYVSWYQANNYDLVTIKQPLEGEWRVIADIEPGSRVTVVSNLNLRVNPLPNNIAKGAAPKVTFLLKEDGKTITQKDFLSLMEIDSKLLAGNDEFDLKEIWKEGIATSPAPADGKFRLQLPEFDKEGIYQLTLLVNGKSFFREFSHQFTVRKPFGADIKQSYSEGVAEYVLTARAYINGIDYSNTQVVATIQNPDKNKKIRPLSETGLDTWKTSIRPELEGVYEAVIKVKGKYKDGSDLSVSLEPIKFNYSIDGGFVEEQESFEPKVEATSEPEAKATAEPVKEEKDEAAEEEKTESSTPSWVLYAILGVGNILLFGLGYIAFRKIMGGPKTDDILNDIEETEDVAEDEPEPEPESEPEAAPVEEEDLEPPMEDLEVAPEVEDLEPELESLGDMLEETAEPEIEPIEEDDPLFDQESDDAEIPAMEDIAEETPEEIFDADEEVAESNSIDELDDLDQMAVETKNEIDIEKELSEDEDDDDMVSAMLKAQGLDLAEDELDDAISSLIDDLDRESDEDEDT